MSPLLRVLIADDHRVIRDCLTRFVEAYEDFHVVV